MHQGAVMKIIKNDEAVSPVKTVSTEDAVSPVIGVILMVAITVILAAVIAAFVFGMAGTTQTTKTVSLTVTLTTGDDADYGKVTINGGTDLPSLNKLWYSINGGRDWYQVETAIDTTVGTEATQFTVGRIYYTVDKIKGQSVQFKGDFDDGSSQVLLTKQF